MASARFGDSVSGRLAGPSSCLAALVLALAALGASRAQALTVPAEPEASATAAGVRPLPRLLGSDAAPRPGTAVDADERAELSARAAVEHRRARATEALARWATPERMEVRWNAWTGLPHRVWGAGLGVEPGAGSLDTAASAEAAARAFLADRPELWAGEDRPTAAELVL